MKKSESFKNMGKNNSEETAISEISKELCKMKEERVC